MNLANYKKTSTKNKILYKVSFFSVISFLFVYFGIIPAMNTITELKRNIINLEISIQNDNEKEKNLDSLSKKLKTIEPQIDKLNQVFINKNRELEFITTLESIANQNKVTQTLDLKNIPDKATDFTTISLEINALGTFDDLMSYLSELESSKYYININNLSINKGGGGGSVSYAPGENVSADSKLNLSIKADTFFK